MIHFLAGWCVGSGLALYLTVRAHRRQVKRLRRRIDQLETAEVVVRFGPAWVGSPVVRAMVQDLELLERWRSGVDPGTTLYPEVRLLVRLPPLS